MSDNSAKIKQIIADKLGLDVTEVLPGASFIKDLATDSLDVYEIIMELESEFNISIPDEEAEKLTTVGSLIDYVDRNQRNHLPPV